MLGNLIQQLTSNLVPFLLTVFAVALGFFAIHFLHRRRQMIHQERMASLIKGLHYAGVARDIFTKQVDAREHLLRGLRWLLGAAGVSGTAYGFNTLQPGADPLSALRSALIGLLPAAIGLAHLIFCWLCSRTRRTQGLPLSGVTYRTAGRRY